MAAPNQVSVPRSPVEDPSTPYYLHPSEGPGLQLVPRQLTGDHYASWSRAIIIALTIRNKLCFIDGSLPMPQGTADPVTLYAWIRTSTMVFSWILNSVSKEIQPSVLYASSAQEIWDELKNRFEQTNAPRLFQLRRDLANLSQSNRSVMDYYTRMKSLWDELSTFRPSCSRRNKHLNTYFQTECVMNFLMGLNESLTGIRSEILVMDPLPPIAEVVSLVVQEEMQLALNSSQTFAETSKKPNLSTKKRERPYCTRCIRHGHTVETCYRIHGYPPNSKPKPRFEDPHPVQQVSPQDEESSETDIHSLLQELTLAQDQQQTSATENPQHESVTNITCATGTSANSGNSGVIVMFLVLLALLPAVYIILPRILSE